MTKLSSKYKTGEIGRALVIEYLRSKCFGGSDRGQIEAEGLIKHLDDNNFVIAPGPYTKPARRGKAKPKPYTGPVMLGKSHSARLAGQ